MDDCDLGDPAVEPATSQLAPPGSERAEAQFHDTVPYVVVVVAGGGEGRPWP